MPLFAVFFGSMLSGLAELFGRFVIKKTAVIMSGLTALGLATGALMFTFNGIVKPLLSRLFTTSYGQALGMAFPPVAGECIVAIGTCWTACAVYSWQVKSIGLLAKS